VTAFLVYRTIIQQVATQPSEKIVVAAVNLAVGEAITIEHINLSSWPKNTVPSTAIRSLEEAKGKIVRRSFVAGEPLLTSKVIDPALAAQGGLLPLLVPEGLRGVTIKVDEAVRESGFVQPGSRVDVVVSMRSHRGTDRVAKVILQNVPVLAAGQTVEMQDNKPVKVTTVTLALTPEQAERLALGQAESRGKLILATRNVRDEKVITTAGATKAGLFGPSERKPAESRVTDRAPLAVPRVHTHTVSILRGGNVTERTFVREAGNRWVSVQAN
jgi:pilus assembly protein CpaB